MGSYTSSLIVEDTSKVVTVWEDVRLMGKIGTTGIYKIYAGQTYSTASALRVHPVMVQNHPYGSLAL